MTDKLNGRTEQILSPFLVHKLLSIPKVLMWLNNLNTADSILAPGTLLRILAPIQEISDFT